MFFYQQIYIEYIGCSTIRWGLFFISLSFIQYALRTNLDSSRPMEKKRKKKKKIHINVGT